MTSDFTFPVEPEALLAERAAQWQSLGVARRTLDRGRSAIRTMWEDAPGGWTWEWTRLGEELEARDPLAASLVYGIARFPAASTAPQREAHARQLDCYLRAAPRFRHRLDRRVLELAGPAGPTRVPVHLLSGRDDAPVVLLSGGVDTWKMDLHRLASTLCTLLDAQILLLDMPGTGESEVALDPAGGAIYRGALDAVATGRRAVWGLSFGGHWAARIGLEGGVDAVVDIGGPVGASRRDGELLRSLPNGMTGIVAAAMQLDGIPDAAEAGRLLAAFSLRDLLDRPAGVPMLVVNGSADPYVPPEDTTCFRSVPGAEVWLVEGSHHCVSDRFPRVLIGAAGWMRERLHGPGPLAAGLQVAGRLVRPRLR